MRRRTLLPGLCLLTVLPAQQWARDRGPGELLPPQLGGGPAMADLTHWEFAWAFQRDALAAPAVLDALPAELSAPVIAALVGGCRATDPGLAAASLWGLARIGRHDDAAGKALREAVLGGNLLQRPEPVGEVATLALGLAARGDGGAVDALRDLANDTAAGRTLAAQPEVPERTRAFALYGLGLAAEGHDAAELQFRVLAAVERLLVTSDAAPQVRIAALHALLLLHLDAAPKLPAPALVLLDPQWSIEEKPAYLSVRAQVPLAAAAMLRPGDAAAETWRQRLVAAAKAADTPNAVRRSSVHALGRLARPEDRAVGDVLRDLAWSAKDQQTQYLAVAALGSIGGAEHRDWLVERLAAKNTSFLHRPWIAFGLGAGCAARGEALPAPAIAAIEALAGSPNPYMLGGAAAALGLGRATGAAPMLTGMLARARDKEPAAQPLCAALGMLGDGKAPPLLRDLATRANVAKTSAEAMAALAAIGGEELARLRGWLLDPSLDPARRHAAAAALRGRGDASTCEALTRMLADASASIDDRRLAAFALGCLGDRGARHWSARLASSIDYRSATPVLVGLPCGVLRLP